MVRARSPVWYTLPTKSGTRLRTIDWNRFGDNRMKENGVSGLDHMVGTDGKLLGPVGDGNFSKCANRKMTLNGRNLTKCATSRRKILKSETVGNV